MLKLDFASYEVKNLREALEINLEMFDRLSV